MYITAMISYAFILCKVCNQSLVSKSVEVGLFVRFIHFVDKSFVRCQQFMTSVKGRLF